MSVGKHTVKVPGFGMAATGILAVLASIMAFLSFGCARPSVNLDGSKLREVERLSLSIPLYPGSGKLDEAHSSSTPESARVSNKYSSNVSYSDLRSFYLNELTKVGWQFKGERKINEGNEYLGGNTLEFAKGEYLVVLQYAGERSTSKDSDYAVSVSWGAH
jgi:hypothetical protein